MQWSNVVKKGIAVAVMSLGLVAISSPSYAYYTWNRNYHTCWNGVCHSYTYHRYCAGGYCHYHYHYHNWYRYR